MVKTPCKGIIWGLYGILGPYQEATRLCLRSLDYGSYPDRDLLLNLLLCSWPQALALDSGILRFHGQKLFLERASSAKAVVYVLKEPGTLPRRTYGMQTASVPVLAPAPCTRTSYLYPYPVHNLGYQQLTDEHGITVEV